MNKKIDFQPKVFLSYSWSSEGHKQRVREWSGRLLGDGVETVLDQHDLNEGDDKYAFMESMVTDDTVTNVIVVCDKEYAEKSDARESGVGTESQIISAEIYNKVKQTKFIPLVTEFDDAGEPYLPAFLKTRIWIDFSTLEKENNNWEQLVRAIYNRPLYAKPELGKPPEYLNNQSEKPFYSIENKYKLLEAAVFNGHSSVSLHRSKFLEDCLQAGDSLRVRERPDERTFGNKIANDCRQLGHIRNHIINWVILESAVNSSSQFGNLLLEFLEKLHVLKSRPDELKEYNESWFEAHAIFVYETFLYIVAALLKSQAFYALHEVLTNQYYLEETNSFDKFGSFFTASENLKNLIKSSDGKELISPAAEIVKKQANRNDVPFTSIAEAEVLVYMMSLLQDTYWYPSTVNYLVHNFKPRLFQKARRSTDFKNLAIITEYEVASELIETVRLKHGQNNSYLSIFHPRTNYFLEMMNLENLDTLH